MNYNIKKEDIQKYNEGTVINFPKYTSQLINWANQNAQGTRPRIVGQLSELFPEFLNNECDISIDNWESWYTNRYPDSIELATDKIYAQVENLKEAIKLIDHELVRQWVQDLVITKTYNGLYVQRAILASLAEKLHTDYRLASPNEESKGIDGFVGHTPYSIKPITYKTMDRLPEIIEIKMIYYTKTNNGLNIEVEEK
ncbi:MjaI family restriction endonuclease [Sedimentibacter sp.]|uniref:MjaI family restriction endonuclease n=1 Tax=Sedimentibacter sp. TaxID=1960295 RepID=UPI0028A6FE12|nr:MjaI family restriction endonuclease [Sedimentibacter sp.]